MATVARSIAPARFASGNDAESTAPSRRGLLASIVAIGTIAAVARPSTATAALADAKAIWDDAVSRLNAARSAWRHFQDTVLYPAEEAAERRAGDQPDTSVHYVGWSGPSVVGRETVSKRWLDIEIGRFQKSNQRDIYDDAYLNALIEHRSLEYNWSRKVEESYKFYSIDALETENDQYSSEYSAAIIALINTPAPDIEALAFKLQLIVDESVPEWDDATSCLNPVLVDAKRLAQPNASAS